MNITDLLDTTTIILSGVVILLAIIAALCSPFFRLKIRNEEEEQEAADCNDEEQAAEANEGSSAPCDPSQGCQPSYLPQVSIILTPHDNAALLEKHLPALLYQKYKPGYQVIVVVEQNDHETEDALKRIDHAYRQQPQDATLYVTSIPDTSRYVSRKKLAITIGVKAAKTEWLLLTEPYTAPTTDQWLATMARNCTEENNLVIGYTHYEPSTSAYRRFERFHTAAYLMREDLRGTAYRTNGSNLMFRKSEFMAQEGYVGNLELVRGEYDFLVNKFARKGATALETDPKAWMAEDEPSKTTWMHKHVFYVETKKHLFRTAAHNRLYILDLTVSVVYGLALIATAVYAAIEMNPIIAIVAAVSLPIRLITDYVILRRTIRNFGEDLPYGLWYERLIPWHKLQYRIKYRFADKLDFSTHKQ